MGRRRRTCGSVNSTTEYHEERCNGRRNEAHERSSTSLVVLCIIVAFTTVQWSSAEEAEKKCNPRCWKKALSQEINVTDGVYRSGVDNEVACKAICASNETCIGVYWGLSSTMNSIGCWIQVSSAGSSDKLTQANHWKFTQCTDDCLSYCWKPKWDNVKTSGGVYNSMAETEDQCKKVCAVDPMCDGVDWSKSDEGCWLLFKHRRTRDQITHWEIVRNLPQKCVKEEKRCMPHCWTKHESPELKFSDGLFKKSIDSEKHCKDMCASNQTCIGVFWGFNPILSIVSCFLQMPFQVVPESLTKVNHWSLSNCSDDCLSYCWLPKWDFVQTTGGVYQYGIADENWCKVTCTYANKCTGLDFNHTDETCWLLYDNHLVQSPSKADVHHWEIERNLPEVCSDEPSLLSSIPQSPGILTGIVTLPGSTQPAEAANTTIGPPANENLTEAKAKKLVAEHALESGGKGGGADNCAVETGESALRKATQGKLVCPSYMAGILTMAGLMIACVVIIIALIAFIIARTVREQEMSASRVSG